eukprot:8024793-Pyramimonas_sp.AAC.1
MMYKCSLRICCRRIYLAFYFLCGHNWPNAIGRRRRGIAVALEVVRDHKISPGRRQKKPL